MLYSGFKALGRLGPLDLSNALHPNAPTDGIIVFASR
jgi:hypothetical protein